MLKTDDFYTKYSGENIKLYNNIDNIKGKFGELELKEVIIESKRTFIKEQTNLKELKACFLSSGTWNFEETSRDRVKQILLSSGLTSVVCDNLLQTAIAQKTSKNIVIKPGAKILWKLTPAIRNRLYKSIGEYAGNELYSEPLSFNSSDYREWFVKCKLDNRIKDKLSKIVYLRDGICFISDIFLIMPYIKDKETFINLVQTLFRIKTVDAYLILHRGVDESSFIDYWGNMGRNKEVEEIFKAVSYNKKGIGKININKLLPKIPKNRLNTFSGEYEYEQEYKDCHWTTLNFFNNTLLEGYYGLTSVYDFLKDISKPANKNQLKFGDIVEVYNGDDLVHTCTYLADNLVLTKNGVGKLNPFVITYLNTTVATYSGEVEYTKRTISDTNSVE